VLVWLTRKWLSGLAILILVCGCRTNGPRPVGKLHEGQVIIRRSTFNTIRVSQRQGIRRLQFAPGSGIQSMYDTRQPDRLVLAYTRLSMLGLACFPQPSRVLIIGLGGGSMARYLLKHAPNCHLDCVELDPEVIRVAREYFDLQEDPDLTVYAEDGRKYLQRCSQSYDLIFLDAYADHDIPYDLATQEFLALVRSHLTTRGLVVTNLWRSAENPSYRDMMETYRSQFEEIHTIAAASTNNCIVLAFPYKPGHTRESLYQLATGLKDLPKVDKMVWAGYSQPPRGQVLHDRELQPR